MDASILLKSINFEFFVYLEFAIPVFQETAYASNILHQKDDLVASNMILDIVLQSLREWKNYEKFQQIKERAESIAIDLSSVISRQGRRKMHVRYKYSITSTMEDQPYQTLHDYSPVRVCYVFLDKMSQKI